MIPGKENIHPMFRNKKTQDRLKSGLDNLVVRLIVGLAMLVVGNYHFIIRHRDVVVQIEEKLQAHDAVHTSTGHQPSENLTTTDSIGVTVHRAGTK